MRARTNVTRIRNVQFRKHDAPLPECGTISRDLSFSLSFRLHRSLLFAANHANSFFTPFEMRFFSLCILIFFRVVLSVEAIYYFKGHCFYDIDRLLCKKRSSDFCYLFLSLSFSLRSFNHSFARSLVFAHRQNWTVCCLRELIEWRDKFCLLFLPSSLLIALSLPPTHLLSFLFALFTLFCNAVLFFSPSFWIILSNSQGELMRHNWSSFFPICE